MCRWVQNCKHCILLFLHRIWKPRSNSGYGRNAHESGRIGLWRYQTNGWVNSKEAVNCNNSKAILLRYFNPVGAHPSALMGRLPLETRELVPAITQTAIGKLPMMQVYGNDYDTRDGSCIRDYIHVCDIAHAHWRLTILYRIKIKLIAMYSTWVREWH